jgi:hypothetical protein
LLGMLLVACSKRELRGSVERSADAQTYLVVVEAPGCDSVHLDRRPWRHALGTRGKIAPGIREISCADRSNAIQFEVKPGTTFSFDYWGP